MENYLPDLSKFWLPRESSENSPASVDPRGRAASAGDRDELRALEALADRINAARCVF